MPEIVEIKKYCDFIKKHTLNKYITNIKILKGRYKKHDKFEGYLTIKKSLPLKILDVKSKGKFIYILFEKDIILFCTLGLSGGWTFKNDKFVFPKMIEYLNVKDIENYRNNSLNHLNVEFSTDKGILYFFDTLSFGTIKVINNSNILEKKLSKIGSDIMDISTTLAVFTNASQDSYPAKKIGLLLLDQKIISGIGNYLRADILWMAKVSPHRLIKTLTPNEIKKIYNSARALTWGRYNYNKAIKLKIMKPTKLPEHYKRDFFVYYEDFDIYGNPVKKEELYEGSQKRFIYWCPGYQK